ncbi:formylmethanofuran dehydrogenase subunit E family protein [Candidatus Aerophobetes bacterium]|nr:formylmethanofuran dehydrogenase subunit E family protein [Candidatus Aerophobetes bacterium]
MKSINPDKVNLIEQIKKGKDFHGHLGPFLVAGIKMGNLALKELNSTGYTDLKVEVETGTTPPISCLIDGIQISTGCTLGKGNILVKNKGKTKATFIKDKKKLEIELRAKILSLIKKENEDVEKLAEKVVKLSEDELFLYSTY